MLGLITVWVKMAFSLQVGTMSRVVVVAIRRRNLMVMLCEMFSFVNLMSGSSYCRYVIFGGQCVRMMIARLAGWFDLVV